MAKRGRPGGLNRKAYAGMDPNKAHQFALYGEAAVEAPVGFLNLAKLMRVFSGDSEALLEHLLFKPLREQPEPEPDGFEAACRAADAANGLHPPPTRGQIAAEVIAELVRMCVRATETGNAATLRDFAACVEAVHRVNVEKRFHDPMRFPLDVLWQQSGSLTRDGKRLIPHYRADILPWVRGLFRDTGLGECTDKRLRVAMADSGYVCAKGRRGGKRPGAGRPKGPVL